MDRCMDRGCGPCGNLEQLYDDYTDEQLDDELDDAFNWRDWQTVEHITCEFARRQTQRESKEKLNQWE